MNAPEQIQTAHHDLGPSAAARWMNCPGSVEVHVNTSSSFADEGSAAHELADKAAREGKPAREYIGAMIYTGDDGTEYFVDDDMADYVQEYLDFCEIHKGEFHGFEEKVSLAPWIPGGFGTRDFFAVEDNTLTVVDLKYGKGERVFARKNPQLRLYALGTMMALNHLYDIEEVRIVIHQPRLDHIDDDVVPAALLLEWAEREVAPAVAAVKPGAPRLPGTKQCRWCSYKAECPELFTHTSDLVKADFPILEDETIDEDLLPVALANVDLVRDWANAVEAHATHQLEQGIAVPGYKLVEGRSTRKWRDNEQAEEVLRKLAKNQKRFKVGDFFISKMVTAPQAQKVVGKTLFEQKLKDLVTKPPGKATLAKADDKRPAINSAEALGFDDKTQETQEN